MASAALTCITDLFPRPDFVSEFHVLLSESIPRVRATLRVRTRIRLPSVTTTEYASSRVATLSRRQLSATDSDSPHVSQLRTLSELPLPTHFAALLLEEGGLPPVIS